MPFRPVWFHHFFPRPIVSQRSILTSSREPLPSLISQVPNVTREDYTLIDLSDEGFVSSLSLCPFYVTPAV